MDKCVIFISLMVFVLGFARAQNGGCTSFRNFNSSSLRTDNIAISNTQLRLSPGWYRFTGTLSGVISTSCPNVNNQCGAKQQAWVQGQLPGYSSGPVKVDVCIRTVDKDANTQCCGRTSTIQMQNCNSFYVYFLTPLPADTNFCFNVSAVTPLTVKTTSTIKSTTATTIATTSNTLLKTSATLTIARTAGSMTSNLKPLTTFTKILNPFTFTNMTLTPRKAAITMQSATQNVTTASFRYSTMEGAIGGQQTPVKNKSQTNKKGHGVIIGATVGGVVLCAVIGITVYVKKCYRPIARVHIDEIEHTQKTVANVHFNPRSIQRSIV